MNKLSTGDDATLGNYRRFASAVFGQDSKAVKFLDDKIAESPDGEKEEVIAAESQMIHLLGTLVFGPSEDSDNGR